MGCGITYPVRQVMEWACASLKKIFRSVISGNGAFWSILPTNLRFRVDGINADVGEAENPGREGA